MSRKPKTAPAGVGRGLAREVPQEPGAPAAPKVAASEVSASILWELCPGHEWKYAGNFKADCRLCGYPFISLVGDGTDGD